MDWQPIDSAPKDGTEILGYRKDCGVILIRWTAPVYFLSDRELEQEDRDYDSDNLEDWFFADFICGGRLEGEETPTHWQPLPPPPQSTSPKRQSPHKGGSEGLDDAMEQGEN